MPTSAGSVGVVIVAKRLLLFSPTIKLSTGNKAEASSRVKAMDQSTIILNIVVVLLVGMEGFVDLGGKC
jgi:hypothetical protein